MIGKRPRGGGGCRLLSGSCAQNRSPAALGAPEPGLVDAPDLSPADASLQVRPGLRRRRAPRFRNQRRQLLPRRCAWAATAAMLATRTGTRRDSSARSGRLIGGGVYHYRVMIAVDRTGQRKVHLRQPAVEGCGKGGSRSGVPSWRGSWIAGQHPTQPSPTRCRHRTAVAGAHARSSRARWVRRNAPRRSADGGGARPWR